MYSYQCGNICLIKSSHRSAYTNLDRVPFHAGTWAESDTLLSSVICRFNRMFPVAAHHHMTSIIISHHPHHERKIHILREMNSHKSNSLDISSTSATSKLCYSNSDAIYFRVPSQIRPFLVGKIINRFCDEANSYEVRDKRASE